MDCFSRFFVSFVVEMVFVGLVSTGAMKRALFSGSLLVAGLCLLVFAATSYRAQRTFRNPVAYAFSGQSLYVLEKEKNTLLQLSHSASGPSMEACGAYEIEPDDADHYYMVRKLYPGPEGIVVQSYIYRRQTGELRGYRFSSYPTPEHPPRSLLTIFLQNPQEYPEVVYACDSGGHHYFANNIKGFYNIWKVAPSGGILVENDSIPSDVRIMGTQNGPLDQWCSMAVGPDGSMYLSSGASGKIVRYSPDGEMVREIGSVGFRPGDLLAPDDVFFARMSSGEPPFLTVASKGNRSWVQFDDAGAPVRVFQPLESGGPFADTLVGRLHADPDGEKVYGLDLANRSLITFGGKGIEASGAYTIFLPGRTMALAAAALLLIAAALYVRSGSVLPRLPRVRVPVFVKILILFIPILVLTARFVAVGVNDTMKEEVRAESLRRSANLAQAVLNSLSLEDLEAIQNPEDREGPVYSRVQETIRRILGGGKVEQTPKWILHKIKDGRYYYGVNIWRGAIFMPCVVPKERQMFFRALQEKTPQYGRYTDDEGEWVSYLAPVADRSGNVIYVLELYRQAEELDRAQGLVARRVAQTVAVIVLATILLLSIFSYLFTWPLRQLTRRTEIISAGNFEESVDIPYQDELGDLARAFNKMVVDLKGYTLELARTAAERESFESELRLARQLQEDVLPRVFPPLSNTCNVAMHAEVMPAREVGGDYYDFFLIDDSHLGVVVADVSGKGVPAGLFMMRIRALLRASAMGNLSPADTLSRINQLIVPENPSAMFATLFYFICHMGSGRIVYCNAGHNPPFRLGNGRAAPVGMENGEGKGLPIGIMEDAGYTDGFFEMGADDVLVVYSDGVTDSSDEEGDFFGEENLSDLLASSCAHHPREICQKVLDRVKAHQGAAKQFDDITILAFRRCGDGDAEQVKADCIRL